MKKMQKILLGLALVMLITASVRPAMSYFTTYVTAKGGYAVHISENSRIDELVDDLTKKITLTNTDARATEYVRARAITSSRFPVTYTANEGWVDGGDKFYYYTEPLAPGASTASTLDVTIDLPKNTKASEVENFNVVFVYESVPVLYGEDGNPLPYNDPATWSQTITTDTQEGGN